VAAKEPRKSGEEPEDEPEQTAATPIHTRFKFSRIDIHNEHGNLSQPWSNPGPSWPTPFPQVAEKETTLTTKSDEARARAEASFKKEERAKEGAKAMTEYMANGEKVREKTERLRALRLAKEAAERGRAG
jgi:hypothetical protein